MELYHYTCLYHLNSIFNQGFLKLTESNISLKKQNYGPPVVWLTTCPNFFQLWMRGFFHATDITDKGRVRILVNARNPQHWPKWSREQGIKKGPARKLARTGGDPQTWYVSEEIIPKADWLLVEDTKTGEVIWRPEGVNRALAS